MNMTTTQIISELEQNIIALVLWLVEVFQKGVQIFILDNLDNQITITFQSFEQAPGVSHHTPCDAVSVFCLGSLLNSRLQRSRLFLCFSNHQSDIKDPW